MNPISLSTDYTFYGLRKRSLRKRSLFPWLLRMSLLVFMSSWLLPHEAPPVHAQQMPDDNAEIVYLGLYGQIRVIDPTVLGAEQVQWFSPEEGFRDFALGDVNGDGDSEIIGVQQVEQKGKLVIYDPVVNSPIIIADGEVNNIPWKKLYEKPLDYVPTAVVAGNFVADNVTDEIIYSLAKGQGTSDLVLLEASGGRDGFTWDEQLTVSFARIWADIAVGDIDMVGTDEIVLCDEDNSITSRIEAYRMDDGSFAARRPFFLKESEDRRWVATTIGQVYPDGSAEVVALRKSEFQTPDNAFIFQYNPDTSDPDLTLYDVDVAEAPGQELDDGYLFDPRVQVTFLANINGTFNNESDQEIFFLRNVPFGNQPRLFMRNRGSDNPVFAEQILDGDNGYKAGAAGDVDGDGKDEIVIMRNNRIRVYLKPDENLTILREDSVDTDSLTLIIGDLDKNGFLSAAEGTLIQSVYLPIIQN